MAKSKSSMNSMMKECMKPHALMHSVMGLGLGLVLANVFPDLVGQMGLWVGVGLLVLAMVGDYTMQTK